MNAYNYIDKLFNIYRRLSVLYNTELELSGLYPVYTICADVGWVTHIVLTLDHELGVLRCENDEYDRSVFSVYGLGWEARINTNVNKIVSQLNQDIYDNLCDSDASIMLWRKLCTESKNSVYLTIRNDNKEYNMCTSVFGDDMLYNMLDIVRRYCKNAKLQLRDSVTTQIDNTIDVHYDNGIIKLHCYDVNVNNVLADFKSMLADNNAQDDVI